MKLNTFGDRLREARQQRELTQGEVSRLLNIKQQRYQPWEAGRKGKLIEPPQEMVVKLAEILAVSVEWLMSGKTADGIAKLEAHYGRDPIMEKIVALLRDMDNESKREILKNVEEKKYFKEMIKQRKGIG